MCREDFTDQLSTTISAKSSQGNMFYAFVQLVDQDMCGTEHLLFMEFFLSVLWSYRTEHSGFDFWVCGLRLLGSNLCTVGMGKKIRRPRSTCRKVLLNRMGTKMKHCVGVCGTCDWGCLTAEAMPATGVKKAALVNTHTYKHTCVRIINSHVLFRWKQT